MSALLHFAEAQYQAALLQLEAARRLLDEAQRTEPTVKPVDQPVTWVFIGRLAELTGLTKDAIHNRVARGTFIENVHYRKEHPGKIRSRLIFNLENVNLCLAGRPVPVTRAASSTTEKSESGSPTRANAASNP
jgi:hypothetical protein